MEIRKPPYYQFYCCAPELFKDYRTRSVFEFLFCEFLKRTRKGESEVIPVTSRNISIKANVSRMSVKDTLLELESMGLINLNENTCVVNAGYFMSVVSLYNFANADKRPIIKSAFLKHDTQSLKNNGLMGYGSVNGEVSRLSAGSPEQNDSTQLQDSSTQLQDSSTQLQDSSTQLQDSSTILSGLNTILRTYKSKNAQELQQIISSATSKLAIISENNDKALSKDEKTQVAVDLMSIGGCLLFHDGARILQLLCQNLATAMLESSNSKYKEKKEKNEQRAQLDAEVGVGVGVEEGYGDYRGIGGMGEKGKKGEQGEDEEEDEGGFEGLEIIQLVNPISEKEIYAQHKKEKPFENVYRNKPYFSERVMEKITGNIEECTKSPVKLFIYNLWGGLYDWYQAEVEDKLPVDEYGNPLSDSDPSDLDMIGIIISERMMARIVKQAWYETDGQIECKQVELDGATVPLEIDELPDIRLSNLIDWRSAVNENGERGFVISLEGFRNVEASDVTEVKKPKTKEEKKAFNKQNRQFIAAISSMDHSQLTPIESAIKSFSEAFLRMDENFYVEGFMNGNGAPMLCNELPGYLITPWALGLKELEVKPKDFYSTFNLPEDYKDGSALRMMGTTFSYQKVVRWNEMNGFQSKINEETLRNAV